MAVSTLLVKSYALNVYMTGKNTLSNIETVRPDYVEPVKQRGADTFYIEDIDDALTKGWITPTEHDDTLALKGPEDLQSRPIPQLMTTTATADTAIDNGSTVNTTDTAGTTTADTSTDNSNTTNTTNTVDSTTTQV